MNISIDIYVNWFIVIPNSFLISSSKIAFSILNDNGTILLSLKPKTIYINSIENIYFYN